MDEKHSKLKHIDFALIDLFSIIASFLISYYIKHKTFDNFKDNKYIQFTIIIVIINIIIVFFQNINSGILKRGYYDELISCLKNSIVNAALVVLVLFILKVSSIYSRQTIILTYILYFIISYFIKIVYKRTLIENKKLRNINTKSLFIFCEAKNIKNIIKDVNDENSFYRISQICIVDLKQNNVDCDFTNLISIEESATYISRNWIDEIIISTNIELIPKEIIQGIEISRIPMCMYLNDKGLFENKVKNIKNIGNKLYVYSQTNNITESQKFLKRLFDVFGSIIGCFLFLIIIIFVGPLIYIKSPGPIIYKSTRVGKNGKLFTFYKIRSMINNADELKSSLSKNNIIKDGMMFKIENDPRIIPGIGQFIRKTSIDEFPQFFNVLKGDMSLIGTRPPTIDEWNKYTPYYRSRLSIRPGITGLWQISGRSDITNFDEVVKLDNQYIDNWSISLDIKILFSTVLQVFKKNNGAK